MTTPQNPGDGDTPQDPSEPQNPYGSPPPPPPPPPSTAPSTPPSTPPSDPPPYGEPPAVAATPPAPPYDQAGVTGQPGQPGYPAPGYPAPGYPGPMPGPAEPGKGMAITSLVLAILGCTCIAILVAIPLAIVVLVRSRGGQNHGRGLAIVALVVSVLYIIAWAIGGYFLYDYAKDFKDVNDLKPGNCITAKGLTDESSSGVTEIRGIGCSEKHDGEVLSTGTLTADEADNYGKTSPVEVCTPSVTAAGSADLLANPDLILIALTEDASPAKGDKLVCVIANVDGSKLTSKLGS